MLVTLLLSWLLAAEPACRSACASDVTHTAIQHAPPAACDDGVPTRPQSESPAILSFEASWCAPCQQMKSVLARLKGRGVRIRHVDVDREPELARKHCVQSTPTYIVVASGREVHRLVGASPYSALARLTRASDPLRQSNPPLHNPAPGAAGLEHLIRATYELSPEKTDALKSFLERFASDAVELRTDGGRLVVTASPHVQHAVGQFISVVLKSDPVMTAPAEGLPHAVRVSPHGQIFESLLLPHGLREDAAKPKPTTNVRHTTCIAVRKNTDCAAESKSAGCDRACGEDCTNECGGKCKTACEDGVARGAAPPDAPGCPLMPPVWMPQAVPERLMFGVGVNSSAGVVGRLILDEPAIPRFAQFRGVHKTGPYTLVLTGDRELVENVSEYIRTRTDAAEPDDAESAKRPCFSFGFGEITR